MSKDGPGFVFDAPSSTVHSKGSNGHKTGAGQPVCESCEILARDNARLERDLKWLRAAIVHLKEIADEAEEYQRKGDRRRGSVGGV